MKNRFKALTTVTTIVIFTLFLTNSNIELAEAKTLPVKSKQVVVQQKKTPTGIKISAKKIVPAKTVTVKKQLPAPKYITTAEVKDIIATEIASMVKEGKIIDASQAELSFGKLHSLNKNYDESNTGFQPVYIPVTAIHDVGTFFSATNISADNTSGNNANFSNLTVSEAASLNGGLTLTAPSEGDVITADSGAFLSPGGVWTNASGKNLKENFTPLNSDEILEKINGLGITRWNYIKEPSSTYHIGPMAEDFHIAFGLGGSAGEKSISTIDPAGIALAGIQALSKKITDLSWLKEGIKQFGITLETGLVKIKNLVADKMQTNELEIGSQDLPTGITIYDKITKQPMCIEVVNGIIQTKSGRCEVIASNTTPPIVDMTAPIAQTELPLPNTNDLGISEVSEQNTTVVSADQNISPPINTVDTVPLPPAETPPTPESAN